MHSWANILKSCLTVEIGGYKYCPIGILSIPRTATSSGILYFFSFIARYTPKHELVIHPRWLMPFYMLYQLYQHQYIYDMLHHDP
ncbi:MAG: hypothetical protein K0R21_828 [Anaerocolumna sp.]|nr:hypothetical protein [Anaerocolumna sp.]